MTSPSFQRIVKDGTFDTLKVQSLTVKDISVSGTLDVPSVLINIEDDSQSFGPGLSSADWKFQRVGNVVTAEIQGYSGTIQSASFFTVPSFQIPAPYTPIPGYDKFESCNCIVNGTPSTCYFRVLGNSISIFNALPPIGFINGVQLAITNFTIVYFV